MSVKRAEILKSALSEIGNHNDDGSEYGRYLSGSYNWCSEFVSYVYKEAGYPFTNGSYSSQIENAPDNGEWMQRTTKRIIHWFKEHSIYIGRGSEFWYDFLPRAGDYVFIGRYGSDRMHSGLVEYTACNGTLNTIEGNNSGRKVMRFQYPHYLINDKDNGSANGIVLGFGVIRDV